MHRNIIRIYKCLILKKFEYLTCVKFFYNICELLKIYLCWILFKGEIVLVSIFDLKNSNDF